MRLFFASAAALGVLASPAFAQDRNADEMARTLKNPVVQETVAAVLGNLAGIVLDTRVGALAPYVDVVRPNDSLRDVERRRDPQFERRLRADTRRAVATAGAVAGDTLEMAENARATADRLQSAIAPLAALLSTLARDPDE